MGYQNWNNIFFGNELTLEVKESYEPHKEGIAEYFVRTIPDRNVQRSRFEVRTRNLMFPSPLGKKYCTIMLLINLATPDWMSVPCHTKFFNYVVCQRKPQSSPEFVPTLLEPEMCQPNSVLNNGLCFSFHGFYGHNMSMLDVNTACISLLMTPIHIVHAHRLDFILTATEHTSTPLLIQFQPSNFTQMFQYFNDLAHRQKRLVVKEVASSFGYTVCFQKSFKETFNFGNVFVCQNHVVISSSLVLDGTEHCEAESPQDSDEKCVVRMHPCPLACPTANCSCSAVHYKSHEGKCKSYIGLKQPPTWQLSHRKSFSKNYTCISNEFIHITLVDDLVPDCKFGDDESVFKVVAVNKSFHQCADINEVPCRHGHPKCFDVHNVCIFKLSSLNHLLSCRTGSHLQNCTNYECAFHFKCPKFYCIPWNYVCDGKWDCPYGKDEGLERKCGLERVCQFLFKCKDSQVCLHITQVCDSDSNCPFSDDETLCHLKNTFCVQKCQCLNQAIFCSGTSVVKRELNNLQFASYYVTKTELSDLSLVASNHLVISLIFTQNHISDICSVTHNLFNLVLIDLTSNLIHHLLQNCFNFLQHLKRTVLKNNQISVVEKKSFSNLSNVDLIDLSHNKLCAISPETFFNISRIGILNVANNPLSQMNTNMLKNLFMENIVTSSLHLCCGTQEEVKCTPATETSETVPGTCSTLFSQSSSLHVTLFTSSFIILLTIICFAFNQCQHSKQSVHLSLKKAYQTLVLSFCLAPTFYSIYLKILAIASLHIGEDIVLKGQLWKGSIDCYLAHALKLTHSIIIPCSLCVVSLARLMVVKFPVNSKFKSRYFLGKIVLGMYACSSGVSFLLTFVAYNLQKVLDSPYCSPFVDTHSLGRTQICLLLISIYHIVSCAFTLLLSIVFTAHFWTAEKEQTKWGFPSNKRSFSKVKLFLPVFTNTLAWSQIDVVFFTQFYISAEVVDLLLVWTLVLVPSLNDVLNILLFYTK